MTADLVHAPHFGVFHLNLHEAGLLIAKCLWFRGELTAKVLEKDAYCFHDSDVEMALAKQAASYCRTICAAIADESLKAAVEQRDLENNVVPARTFVEALTLMQWLECRHIFLGDTFDDEYLFEESDLARKTADYVAAERYRARADITASDEDLATNASTLFLKHRITELEEELSRHKLSPLEPSPITEKQRGAYLNIIGALVSLLLGQSPGGEPYSKFKTQQSIIDAIQGMFGEQPGLSTRNLHDKFALGKRQLDDVF